MATYYVSTTGSDAADGLSPATAWLTLGHAESSTAAGDTINVKAGSYSETLTLTVSGTAPAPRVWAGYAATPGDGGRFTIEGGNARASCVVAGSTTGNLFQGAVFQGATAQLVAVDAADLAFVNCRFLKGSAASVAGFAPVGSSTFIVSAVGCEFADLAGVGCGATSFCQLGQVRWCEIHGCTGHGIAAGAYRSIAGVVNNLIYGNGGDGINVPNSCPASTIARNTIHGNGGNGITIDGSSNSECYVAGNLLTANLYGLAVTSVPSGSTRITTARNFFGGGAAANTSGGLNDATRVTSVLADVTLTADPYTDAAGYDLSLNSAAGGGAAVRAAAGFQAFPGGTMTGYSDGGAVQHQDAGGGGGGAPVVGSAIVRGLGRVA